MRLCLATAEILEAWSSPKGPSNFETSVVSPHPVPLLIDMVLSSPDLTPIVEGDVSPIPIAMHPLQPRIK
jgi:hypothetical protein